MYIDNDDDDDDDDRLGGWSAPFLPIVCSWYDDDDSDDYEDENNIKLTMMMMMTLLGGWSAHSWRGLSRTSSPPSPHFSNVHFSIHCNVQNCAEDVSLLYICCITIVYLSRTSSQSSLHFSNVHFRVECSVEFCKRCIYGIHCRSCSIHCTVYIVYFISVQLAAVFSLF